MQKQIQIQHANRINCRSGKVAQALPCKDPQQISLDDHNISLIYTDIIYTDSVADPDPGSVAFLTPGSGMGRKSASGSGIRDEQPGSYFLELRNHFFGLKYLNS